MSKNATTISRKVSRATIDSLRRSNIHRADAAVERAEAAVRRAQASLEQARAAAAAVRETQGGARVGDVARAADAASGAASDARAAADSAASARISAEMVSRRRPTSPAAGHAESAGRYFVVRNGELLASFAREDDALLFEGELADLDVAHGVDSVRCEVVDRGGRRRGGYFVTAGRLVACLSDDTLDARLKRGGIGGPRW